jgi:hypothetical protein
MSLVVPNEGELLLLGYIVNKDEPVDLTLRLYTVDITLAESTQYANFTEATAAGYAAQTLTGSDWSTSMVATDTATATHVEKTFTMTAAATIYGYYVTAGTSKVMWAERFSGAPFVLPAGGGTIAITPKVTLD